MAIIHCTSLYSVHDCNYLCIFYIVYILIIFRKYVILHVVHDVYVNLNKGLYNVHCTVYVFDIRGDYLNAIYRYSNNVRITLAIYIYCINISTSYIANTYGTSYSVI